MPRHYISDIHNPSGQSATEGRALHTVDQSAFGKMDTHIEHRQCLFSGYQHDEHEVGFRMLTASLMALKMFRLPEGSSAIGPAADESTLHNAGTLFSRSLGDDGESD